MGVAKPFESHAHPVHEGEVQAARAAVVGAAIEVIEDPPGSEGSPAAAGKKYWHLVHGMPVAVEQVRTTHEDRVIEQGPVPFLDTLETLDQVGELRDVELVRLQVHRFALGF